MSFGSQGLVQDVITGLTVVFTDILDAGDMVELGGQVGIVESIGIRFTVLVNFTGARVFVQNRTVANVISHPQGFVRAYLDVRLPADAEAAARSEQRLALLARAYYEQFPAILLLPPSLDAPVETSAGYRYLRVEFRIWPGQGALIETHVRQGVVQTLREIDPTYADWMTAVHYRAESAGADPSRRLPRPAAIQGPRPPVSFRR